jgi:predicted nucleic acid-binding Zn ribbon protein
VARVSASRVVEVVPTIGVPELLRLDRQRGGGSPIPGATMVSLETRPASTLLPNSRVVFVLCPACRSRRRSLFWLGGRLACRRCHRLPYQSQTHGHWTGPLVDALHARCRLFARRPGPKGRRYRLGFSMSSRKSPSLARPRAERSGVVGSPEPACVVCGGPRDPRKRETCSDACRAALSRARRARAQLKCNAEIRAMLEAALEKLREDP